MKRKLNQSPGPGRELRKLGLFTAVMTDLIAYTGAGIGIGYFLWKKWNAPWWVLLLTSILGLSWAFFRLYKLSQKEL